MAETLDTAGTQPEAAALPGPSNRGPAIAVSLAALAVIGAATANSLPDLNRFSLTDFSRNSLPNFDHISLPDFSLSKFSLPNFSSLNFSWPNFDDLAVRFRHETASAPIPDPVSVALKDIQISQQQNAVVLVSLTQSSAAQQGDLKRISRQLYSLAAQAEALQNAVSPLTTSSIPHHLNYRARVVRTSRRTAATLPKPFGPVSVGGAPLSPAPASNPGPG